MADWTIRAGTRADVAALADIERASDGLFPDERLPPGDETYPVEALRASCDAGLLIIAEVGGRIAGFAFCAAMGDRLHLAGLAVHPDFGRRGIGAALVQRVMRIARDRALVGVTLTTFDDLPWNGPFYRRLGFQVLAERDLSPFLAATLERERAAGMRERVAMLAETGCQKRD